MAVLTPTLTLPLEKGGGLGGGRRKACWGN